MSSIFNYNNPVLRFIGGVIDVIVLHLCWILCSLPIVTLGASTAALYYTLMNDITDENGAYVKCFFKSFRDNLWPGIRLTLVLLLVGGILAASLYSVKQMDLGGMQSFIQGLDILVIVCLILAMQYMFVLLGYFHVKLMDLMQNALFLALRHFGRTIMMLCVPVAMFAAIYYIGFYALILPGFGLVAYLDCYILKPVIMPLVRKARGEDEEEPPKEEDGNKKNGFMGWIKRPKKKYEV